MTIGSEAKLGELNTLLDWLEAGRIIVPNKPDHAELLAILESAIAKTKFSIQTLGEPKSKEE